ncbi:MAG: M23 family peptidase, partial [Spirochaetia bacterium]|nr:M23 family peptidase [Spirochaetia bacterium]
MNIGKHLLLTLILLSLATFSLFSLFAPSDKPSQGKNAPLEKPKDPWITQTVPDGGSIFSLLEKLNLPGPEIGKISYRFGDYI